MRSASNEVVEVGVCGGYSDGVAAAGVGYDVLLPYDGVLSDDVAVGVETGMLNVCRAELPGRGVGVECR